MTDDAEERSPEDAPLFAVLAIALFPLSGYVDAFAVSKLVTWHLTSLGVPTITTTQAAVMWMILVIVRGSSVGKSGESWGRICVSQLFWCTLSLVALGVGAVLR